MSLILTILNRATNILNRATSKLNHATNILNDGLCKVNIDFFKIMDLFMCSKKLKASKAERVLCEIMDPGDAGKFGQKVGVRLMDMSITEAYLYRLELREDIQLLVERLSEKATKASHDEAETSEMYQDLEEKCRDLEEKCRELEEKCRGLEEKCRELEPLASVGTKLKQQQKAAQEKRRVDPAVKRFNSCISTAKKVLGNSATDEEVRAYAMNVLKHPKRTSKIPFTADHKVKIARMIQAYKRKLSDFISEEDMPSAQEQGDENSENDLENCSLEL